MFQMYSVNNGTDTTDFITVIANAIGNKRYSFNLIDSEWLKKMKTKKLS